MRINGFTVVVSGLLLASGAALAPQGGMSHQDAREAIRLPATRRDMLLGEMRGLLTSVNGILRGVAAGDTALIRQSAANAGMAAMMAAEGQGMMGPGAGRGMHAGGGMGMGAGGRGMGPMMPEGFRSLMHETRSGFDSLAAQVVGGARADTIVARLARLTNNCLACHAAYRLEVAAP